MYCLFYFFCCCRKKVEHSEELNIEDIHHYAPFKDVIEQPNVYYESLKLKKKLHGQCKDREKKVFNYNQPYE